MSNCDSCASKGTCNGSCNKIEKEKLNEMASVKKVIGVMSGKGGDLLIETCQKVLNDEYPETASKFELRLPDEYFRRVGQSMAVASLPEIK